MDIAFISGMGAFISSIIVFCGSAFLLLMLVMGARLAYLVTASITLAFVLIMGVVWSVNPLGPVGQLPEWDPVALAPEGGEAEFGPASAYPEDPWRAPNEEDPAELTRIAELQSSAQDYVIESATAGEVEGLPSLVDSTTIPEDSTVLLDQEEEQYGATTVEIVDAEGATSEALVVMQYDPGNPLGQARMITAGTLILLVLHLFALSRSEKKAAHRREPAAAA
jgi:hypothetical protein